jgi:CRP-like cAMP-binding protein
LLNSKIFKFNFSIPFLNELSLRIKEALYGPGEVIFTNGEEDHRIFYINKGVVELYLDKKSKNKNEVNIYSYDVLYVKKNLFICVVFFNIYIYMYF